MRIRPRQRCWNQNKSALGSAGGLGCFLLQQSSQVSRILFGTGTAFPWVTVARGTRQPHPTSPPLPAALRPCLSSAGRATGTLLHHQLHTAQEQKKDKGRSPETCRFHRELLQGNKAADVRNASGLFARAALCLRQHGHASACRSRSFCCSGLGASLFPLPFRQAWSQPGIKLFK